MVAGRIPQFEGRGQGSSSSRGTPFFNGRSRARLYATLLDSSATSGTRTAQVYSEKGYNTRTSRSGNKCGDSQLNGNRKILDVSLGIASQKQKYMIMSKKNGYFDIIDFLMKKE